VKCKRRLQCDRPLKRRNSQGSCISVRLVAQAASCTLSDHPPMPMLTAATCDLWRSNEWEVGGGSLGEPRKPKRKRPQQLAAPRISLQAADLAGLRTPGLLVFVLTSYATYRQRLAHYKAPGSKLHRRLISLSRGPNFVRQPCNNVWLSH
jgi:hypothetical protein